MFNNIFELQQRVWRETVLSALLFHQQLQQFSVQLSRLVLVQNTLLLGNNFLFFCKMFSSLWLYAKGFYLLLNFIALRMPSLLPLKILVSCMLFRGMKTNKKYSLTMLYHQCFCKSSSIILSETKDFDVFEISLWKGQVPQILRTSRFFETMLFLCLSETSLFT